MKIVVLNPYLNAEHEILALLRKREISVLLSHTLDEAWTVLELHGQSVDLAVIHREGASAKGEPGLELVRRMRESKDHTDLPFILSYEKWSQQDCAAHQATPQGANAYLKYPYKGGELAELIHQITGTPIKPEATDSHTNSKILLAADPSASQEPETPTLMEVELGTGFEVTPPPPSREPIHIEPSIQLDPPQMTEFALEPDPRPAPFESKPEPRVEQKESEPLNVGPIGSAKDFLLNLFNSRSSAIVPGKAGQPIDDETYRKHLALRERDISTLVAQLESSRQRIQSLESDLESERTLNSELDRNFQETKRKLANFDRDKQAEFQNRQKETEQLLSEIRAKNEKVAVLEARVLDAEREIQSIRERVRADLQKIRGRERELENRIELLTRDSEVLLASRENKILELKRRLDTSDFNAELLNEKLDQECKHVKKLQSRLESIAQAMKLADGLVEDNHEQSRPAH